MWRENVLNALQMEENLYERVDGAGVNAAGPAGAVGAMGGVGGVGGVGGLGALGGVGRGAAYWWWRVAPPCRRHRRASQTLEFNERLAPAQGSAPRARRVLCGALHVELAARARLSASCGTIDAPPPRLLLMQRWRAPAPPASRSYHLLPESQRALPLRCRVGAERPCCEADEEAYEADEGEAEAGEVRSRSPSDDDSDAEPRAD